jgi:hypothetical protein
VPLVLAGVDLVAVDLAVARPAAAPLLTVPTFFF